MAPKVIKKGKKQDAIEVKVVESLTDLPEEDTPKSSGRTLSEVMASLNKKYGKGTAIALKDKPDFVRIPTGVYAVDYITGGGIPVGHSSAYVGGFSGGKTTLALNTVGSFQKMCHTCYFPLDFCVCSTPSEHKDVMWLNIEGTLDPQWAKTVGTDTEKVVLIEAHSGEEYTDIGTELAKVESCGLIVVDSIGALMAMSELDNSAESANMGTSARMITKMAKKMKQAIIDAGKEGQAITLLYINQKRVDLKVTHGCLAYDTLVNFVDGRSIPIGKVVSDRIDGQVWSFNEATGQIEGKDIIGWHNNGKVESRDDFIHIQTTSIDGFGRFGLTVTPNHKVLTDTGWKEARNLDYTDKLVSKYTEQINGTAMDFLYGTLVGDSHLCRESDNKCCLKVKDNNNREYMEWKASKINDIMPMTQKSNQRGVQYRTSATYELSKIAKENPQRSLMLLSRHFTPMGFALWIMDNGSLDTNGGHYRYHISARRFANNLPVLESMSSKLADMGFSHKVEHSKGYFRFLADATDKIASYICEYVPEPMQYKLPMSFRGRYVDFTLSNNPVIKHDTVSITLIRRASLRQVRNKCKFDITVKDNHSYMVGGSFNGVIVHNSNETTPGGNAWQHDMSLLLRCAKNALTEGDKVYKAKKDGDSNSATRHAVSIQKNKVYTLGSSAHYVRSVDHVHPEWGPTHGKVMDFRHLVQVAKSVGVLGDDPKKLIFMDTKFATQAEFIMHLLHNPQAKLMLNILVVEAYKKVRLCK